MNFNDIVDSISVKTYYLDRDAGQAIYCSDNRGILPQFRGISAVVTDPPYDLTSIVKRFGKEGSAPAKYGRDGSFQRLSKGFMGKEWDGTGISFQADTWRLIIEACLPGAPLLSFGGTRTSHRLACAIEDAGWQIRDTICWVYGSGFPKSLDISKAITALEIKGGSSPQNLRKTRMGKDYIPTGQKDYRKGRAFSSELENDDRETDLTESAKLWEGYGTALKPAYEPILVCMKPLDGAFANNALKHKVAGLNIDGCRIPLNGDVPKAGNRTATFGTQKTISGGDGSGGWDASKQGRFPANFIHDGSQEVMELFPDSKSSPIKNRDKEKKHNELWLKMIRTGVSYYPNDSGSAARFFYTAKASRKERDAGLEDMPLAEIYPQNNSLERKELNSTSKQRVRNQHPTVKPLSLMTYLCKLVKMPEYNLILDPFCGSGTTLLACKKLGIPSVGIDSNEEYCEIAAKRCSQSVMRLE